MDIQNHSQKIASKVVATFQEDKPVRAGFSDFFPRETTPTLHVDIQVERDSDLISVDVVRFAEGNKNQSTRLTEKKFQPPFHKEEYDFARDEIYMNTVAMGVMNVPGVNKAIAQNGLKNVRKARAKIERAIRKQYCDVLQTGIVELNASVNIDYGRKADSIVNLGAGNYWNQSGSNPLANFTTGMRFLRDEGSSSSSTVNIVMRDAGLNSLLNNDNEALSKILDKRRIDRANIVMPQFSEATGMAFHGQLASGDFIINLWTYNESYMNAQGTRTFYLDENKAIMLPSDFVGKTVFGGLPYMRKGPNDVKVPGVIEKAFLLRGYDDERTISSTLELTSAPLAIPVTVDKIYTMQILA